MNSVRFAKLHYVAAFLLGAVIAVLLTVTARSEEGLGVERAASDPAVGAVCQMVGTR